MQTFQVFPNIPKEISFLEELSRNIWWCWHPEAEALFHRINPQLWEEAHQNPITFLTLVSQKQFEALAVDKGFISHIERIQDQFEAIKKNPADRASFSFGERETIAYFSMEFGLHESIPLFSGGLGVLSGDHLKAASDIGLPLTGVGLLYRQGYFRQYLDQNGWQQDEYPETDLFHLPLERALDDNGNEVRIIVHGPEGEIHVAVWQLIAGSVTLLLLDTDLPENSPKIRDITARLYGGGQKMRLAQEILLGIGGMRALYAMGLEPSVCHLNEGHAAFSGIERIIQIISQKNIDLATALEIIPRTTVFTTHTPVAAGYDEFSPDMVKPYLKPLEELVGVKAEEMLSWGQCAGSGKEKPLSMFVLALRMAQDCNGVSRLHGEVSRRMWKDVWPGVPEDEVPITHVTNGVHITSWLSRENFLLLENYLGQNWCEHPHDADIQASIDNIYDDELWRAHAINRLSLINFCRKRVRQQYERRNASKAEMQELENMLDPDALTIGFARRFATYKRADLITRDFERLKQIITSADYPIQLIFAGKAHPMDNEGKALIQHIVNDICKSELRHKIIFIEDYDINVARYLVQGVDVWLNTPRRPMEACGTSGMKAAINGVLNVSILDGWWCEGYSPECGWSIGGGEEYRDHEYQDSMESQALYNILENDVVPCFYERESGGIPYRWVRMMKESMKMSIHNFCSHRMVNDYKTQFYMPAAKRYKELLQNNAEKAKMPAVQRKRLHDNWEKIRIETPAREKDGPYRVSETLRITVRVLLGDLTPDEVRVQLYYGIWQSIGSIQQGNTEEMSILKNYGNGEYLYECFIKCGRAGRYGFTARVTPQGDKWIHFAPGLITWA